LFAVCEKERLPLKAASNTSMFLNLLNSEF
jgi:hypothetical protein